MERRLLYLAAVGAIIYIISISGVEATETANLSNTDSNGNLVQDEYQEYGEDLQNDNDPGVEVSKGEESEVQEGEEAVGEESEVQEGDGKMGDVKVSAHKKITNFQVIRRPVAKQSNNTAEQKPEEKSGGGVEGSSSPKTQRRNKLRRRNVRGSPKKQAPDEKMTNENMNESTTDNENLESKMPIVEQWENPMDQSILVSESVKEKENKKGIISLLQQSWKNTGRSTINGDGIGGIERPKSKDLMQDGYSLPVSYSLKGVRGFVTPELLAALASCGLNEEMALVDQSFPIDASQQVMRLAGVPLELLAGEVMNLWRLAETQPIVIMVGPDSKDVANSVKFALAKLVLAERECGRELDIQTASLLSREQFIERVKKVKYIVSTGEPGPWDSIIIRKGFISGSCSNTSTMSEQEKQTNLVKMTQFEEMLQSVPGNDYPITDINDGPGDVVDENGPDDAIEQNGSADGLEKNGPEDVVEINGAGDVMERNGPEDPLERNDPGHMDKNGPLRQGFGRRRGRKNISGMGGIRPNPDGDNNLPRDNLATRTNPGKEDPRELGVDLFDSPREGETDGKSDVVERRDPRDNPDMGDYSRDTPARGGPPDSPPESYDMGDNNPETRDDPRANPELGDGQVNPESGDGQANPESGDPQANPAGENPDSNGEERGNVEQLQSIASKLDGLSSNPAKTGQNRR